jgi:hypothetical protein
MKRIIASLIGLALSASIAFAQVPMTHAGKASPSTGGAGCAEATNWLTAASSAGAGLSGTVQGFYTTLICGLVAQSSTISGTLWSRTDFLGVYGTTSVIASGIDLKSATATQTYPSGQPTFTAATPGTPVAAGFSGGSSKYINLGFNPNTQGGGGGWQAGGLFTMLYLTQSRTTVNGSNVQFGSNTLATGFSIYYSILSAANTSSWTLNDASYATATSGANARGLYFGSRHTGNVYDLYQNPTTGTPNQIGTNTTVIGATPNGNLYVLCWNVVGGSPSNFSGSDDTVGAVAGGIELSDADVAAYGKLLNDFATSMSWNTY